ncbi:hypothetical protein JDV02_000869 [Purpureocillium takamizusanense]|nr:uncharacterized protein JDV02_000869 [Purpureocillium takamizusanense]UNI14218.1 hypothetical protein JDV02_000869 [Purpureocillium takamizusanense]
MDNASCSADVRVEDPQFSKRLCGKLATNDLDYPKAVSIRAPMPQTTNYRRVDSRKVYCSWHKPSQTVWLNFGSEFIARRVSKGFSAGHFKVLNQEVRCKEPTGPSQPARGGRYARAGRLRYGRSGGNHLAWTVMLFDVPALARPGDITKDICDELAPRHVELGGPSYDVDLTTANTSIESLLLKAGPLERWESGIEGAGKRFKAKAWFVNDADARQAAMSLNNTTLPFNNGKLTVQLVHSARLKVPSRVYNVVEPGINRHEEAWAKQHLVYKAYPPIHGLRVLKLEGEASEDVAKAKATLEEMIDGEVLMKDGKAIWSPSFAVNGQTYEKMKQLEQKLGILIVRDKRRCRLRLLGPRPQCQQAQDALTELSKTDSSSTHVIELNAQQLSRAIKGGYQAIAAAIGRDKVSVDITPGRQRILVMGSERDFKVAQRMLQSGELASQVKQEGDSISDCAICWTEAENPVQTACKHVYCASCFENLCLDGVNSGPPVRCQRHAGDAGTCGEVVSLTELQAHLPSAALEDILEAAFLTHLRHNLNQLKNCPTPDCGQIYRAAKASEHQDSAAGTDESLLFKCPSCVKAVCTACNASHDGQTCAEYHYLASDDYKALKALKAESGIKDCPKCGVMIQKSFGCNHMTCTACNAHICWVCLETFSSGPPVYAHMGQKHGGIGIGYYPGLA